MMGSQLNTLLDGGEGALMEGNQRDRGYLGLTIQRNDSNAMDSVIRQWWWELYDIRAFTA